MDDCRTPALPEEAERALIIAAVHRAAAEHGGRPPTEKRFRFLTGISAAAWKGRHWIRWGDLIREAGYPGSARPVPRDDELMLTKLAEVVRHFGKIPSLREMRFYGFRHPGFPGHSTFATRFGGHRMMFERLREWAHAKPEMADV